jgi:meso-butanediol dehydrogenase/(S,S)-butanediol dehydrogenase/diacetyl reductase
LADISDKTELAKELGCLYLKADVSKEEDVANLMEQTYKYYGQIDIVINNAGIIMPEQLLTDANMKDYQKLYSVNVFGVVHGLKYAPRYMKDGGVILNTASNSANGDYAGYGAYISSKCAVVGLTKAASI